MRNMLHKIYGVVKAYLETNHIDPNEIYIPKVWYEKFRQDIGPTLSITILPDNQDWFGDRNIPTQPDWQVITMRIYANGMDDTILLRKK